MSHRWAWAAAVMMALAAVGAAEPAARPRLAIVVNAGASTVETLAADELARGLAATYPDVAFERAGSLPAAGRAILVGSAGRDATIRRLLAEDAPKAREGYLVTVKEEAGREVAVVAGADPAGTFYAAHAVLERLGWGFYLSFDAAPPATRGPLVFDEAWELADEPLVADRVGFNWHNFLSGCSAWDEADWDAWVAQLQKMRFNAVMVHAYGNNPMFTFAHNGARKPVGYLSSTALGRDWGNEHVNDVRRMVGGDLFDGPVFGSAAARVPDDRRAEAKQAMMKRVFAKAAARGMHICFALDIDTASANPQAVIATLPEHARFSLGAAGFEGKDPAAKETWLARPDTPEGYAYYRAQAEALFALYPQIDRLALWIRWDRTPWLSIKAEQLPEPWRREWEARVAAEPALAQLREAPGRFAAGKVVAAFQRAVRELKREDMRVMVGSWGFDWLAASDPFMPRGLAFIPLDYGVLHGKSDVDDPARRKAVRALVDGGRPVIPIVWAHHDDGHYVGRPYAPVEKLATKLRECGADGLGIIHWTTRPLDLYFKGTIEQVWKATADQALTDACAAMAGRCFGTEHAEVMAEYLEAWVKTGPIFGRETSDTFIDRPVDEGAVREAAVERLLTLGDVPPARLDPAARDRLAYLQEMELFALDFHRAEAAYQRAAALVKAGNFDGAAKAMEGISAEPVIERYAKAIRRAGGTNKGELGALVALNTTWLPFFTSMRQALGQEPVRTDFGPTLHGDLAQGAGRLTFHVDPGKRWWRVAGRRELGAKVAEVTFAADARLAGDDAALVEVCRTAVEAEGELTLRLGPAMADVQVRGLTPRVLRPGRYAVTLILADPACTAEGQRVFDVEAGGRTERVDLFARAGAAGKVATLRYPVELKQPGTIEVRLKPVAGKVLLGAAQVEPGTD